MSRLNIKTATLADMSTMIEFAKQEGWNPGLTDKIPFYFTDPEGFFIGYLNDQPIGCISAPQWNSSFGFMGFYIVIANCRGQGYGFELWNHALSYLEGKSIGLDGVPAQQENYKKSGFLLHHNNLRYKGRIEGKTYHYLLKADQVPFNQLVEFDATISGYERRRFLQHWITMPNTYSLVLQENDRVKGFGTLRKCYSGFKIGPLYADSAEIAEDILLSLASYSKGEDLYLDIVQENSEALRLSTQYGFIKVFETARMYKGIAPKSPLSKIFGVTTFELG